MHLKIYATFPGSEFNMNSSLNLLPFPALLNKLFRRVASIQIETSRSLTLQQARELHLFDRGWLPRILPPLHTPAAAGEQPATQLRAGRILFLA